jgi:hypothetical protein
MHEATASSGTMASAVTRAIAARGITALSAPLGSWITTRPPRRLMSAAPSAPSSLAPVSTTAIARGPRASASVENSTSIDGRAKRTGPSVDSAKRLPSIMRW